MRSKQEFEKFYSYLAPGMREILWKAASGGDLETLVNEMGWSDAQKTAAKYQLKALAVREMQGHGMTPEEYRALIWGKK